MYKKKSEELPFWVKEAVEEHKKKNEMIATNQKFVRKYVKDEEILKCCVDSVPFLLYVSKLLKENKYAENAKDLQNIAKAVKLMDSLIDNKMDSFSNFGTAYLSFPNYNKREVRYFLKKESKISEFKTIAKIINNSKIFNNYLQFAGRTPLARFERVNPSFLEVFSKIQKGENLKREDGRILTYEEKRGDGKDFYYRTTIDSDIENAMSVNKEPEFTK